ncbi:ABC transporter permease subunit [Halobellus sp. GM3]|uniref:ABC transporter permease subunit n=1 Tax=Halobellus sp. GM3 TaxID=3458410 RepID=UPI00403DC3A6
MSTRTETFFGRVHRFVRSEVDRQLLLSFLSPVVILVTWEISSRVGVLNPQFFPPPSTVLVKTYDLLFGPNAELIHQTLVSLGRILPAFVIGGGLGIVLGVLMGWSETLDNIFDPVVSAMYPLPKVVLLPILFLIFGLNETSRIVALGLAIFLLVVINTAAGARQVDNEYIEAAKDNGASNYTMLREVILPATLPHIFSGLSLGMGVAFILIVVVEMVAAESGLGYMIWNSWELFTIRRMYVAIITINVLGILFTYGLEWTGKYLTRWREGL